MILCPVAWFFPQLSFVNYLLPLVWACWLCVVVTETELEEKIIPLLVLFFFLTNTLIWLFFLKNGSIITQIKSVWSSNQQWLVHQVALLHNKMSQHCWWTRIVDQGEWIAKKNQYCKKAGVKIGGLCYDFMPTDITFSPVELCELLAATCLRFLVVCGCH